MKSRSESDEWETLTPPERIKCYLLAEQIRQLTKGSSPHLVQTYRDLTDRWSVLERKINEVQRGQRHLIMFIAGLAAVLFLGSYLTFL